MDTTTLMKAAVLYQTGQPLVIEDGIEIPSLLPGQVLVKIAYSGLCRSQLLEVRGGRGDDPYLPHLLGHEGSGTVVDIGEQVTKVQPGDTVVVGWIKGQGADVGGTRYRKGEAFFNAGGVTTFSEYAVVSENRCVQLPEGVPLDIGVLFGCAVPTGAGIVLNEIAPTAGSSLAIFGLGGIGLSALMAAVLCGCAPLIAIDIDPVKLQMAEKIGADYTVNPGESDALAQIRELTAGKGVDFSLEAAGVTSSIELAFQSVRDRGGLCIFASHPDSKERIRLDPHDLIRGKQIRGSWGGECDPDRDILRFAQLYQQGRLPLEQLLSHRYKLEQINQALDDLEQRKIVRALIEMV